MLNKHNESGGVPPEGASSGTALVIITFTPVGN
jgi:hypothetical protein